MSSWRVAPAVLALFKQADLQAPDRNDDADGTIGDTSHSARKSDHNPDAQGWVYAGDLTDDDAAGIDCREIARQIVARRDRRVKYLISEGRMVSSYSTSSRKAWEWGPYSGPNGHFKHLHVSVLSQWRNDTSPWWAPPAASVEESEEVEEEVVQSILFNSEGKTYWRDGGDTIHIPTMADVKALQAAGVKNAGELSPELAKRLLEAAKQ